MSDSLPVFEEKISQAVDTEIKNYINSLSAEIHSDLGDIFRYHLGFNGKEERKGKRIRPLLTALCAEGAGTDWRFAIPTAAAIELVHNFSLIHDDIEDNSEQRRGKLTVWKNWGLPKGINVGDAMFASAFHLISSAKNPLSTEIKLKVLELLSETCIQLTEGQQLDIDYVERDNINKEEYFRMVEGKTAALIACSTRMGALIGGLDRKDQEFYSQFGNYLGIAFQILDDWLGIWGDPRTTGKSACSDLIERKKSYPIILGFEKSDRFQQQWHSGAVSGEDAQVIADFLIEDGIRDMVEDEYLLWTKRALDKLEQMNCKDEMRIILKELSNKLLTRMR